MQSLVTLVCLVTLVSHVISGCHSTTVTLPTLAGGDVTLLAPLSYLPLPPPLPLQNTFHTIKPVIYIAMAVYFVLRKKKRNFFVKF